MVIRTINNRSVSQCALSVSVVIPAYNAEHTIGRAIDSVLSQTVPPLQIIVIDDGSPDRQCDVIREYGDRVELIRQSNGRTASARNTGLAHAQGDLIAFLDADDYWEPRRLERQHEIFEQHPEVGLVAGAYFVQEPGSERRLANCPHQFWTDCVLDVEGERAFRLAMMLWTGTITVRREVLGDERFVSGLEPAEDRDLWARLVLRAPVYFASEPLATAVLESGSISRSDVARDCSRMLAVLQRHRHTLGPAGWMRWRSHTLYRRAALEPARLRALGLLAESMLFWPLPFLGQHGMRRLGRLKRLGTLIVRPSNARRSIHKGKAG